MQVVTLQRDSRFSFDFIGDDSQIFRAIQWIVVCSGGESGGEFYICINYYILVEKLQVR